MITESAVNQPAQEQKDRLEKEYKAYYPGLVQCVVLNDMVIARELTRREAEALAAYQASRTPELYVPYFAFFDTRLKHEVSVRTMIGASTPYGDVTESLEKEWKKLVERVGEEQAFLFFERLNKKTLAQRPVRQPDIDQSKIYNRNLRD